MFDFKQTECKNIENVGEICLLKHKSGARVICVDNNDENMAFSLCFDTPVADNTGIAHILRRKRS